MWVRSLEYATGMQEDANMDERSRYFDKEQYDFLKCSGN